MMRAAVLYGAEDLKIKEVPKVRNEDILIKEFIATLCKRLWIACMNAWNVYSVLSYLMVSLLKYLNRRKVS
jgi:D-arabinose 1-dehydrogenase-like Zn-dependent alcohol dehydrogenase